MTSVGWYAMEVYFEVLEYSMTWIAVEEGVIDMKSARASSVTQPVQTADQGYQLQTF